MTTRSKTRQILSHFSVAALAAFVLTPGPAAAAPLPEVQLHAEMGHSIAEDVVSTSAPAGTDSVRVVLEPPAGGALYVTYDPSDLWEPEAGGSWGATLPLSAGAPDEWHFLMKVVDDDESSEETFVSLTATATATPLKVKIKIEPQAGAITEIVDEILDLICPSYLSNHQNPSESPSPTLWNACAEHEGL